MSLQLALQMAAASLRDYMRPAKIRLPRPTSPEPCREGDSERVLTKTAVPAAREK